MQTIPEPLRLSNAPARPAALRPGFRVPFGLKEGRVWSPGEVEKGKRCGCVCPGCGSPLVAKAKESRRRRPHFAHLTGAGCETGLETGIHLRAKQLIAERAELLLPAWIGDPVTMPNPPIGVDLEGRFHSGQTVDLPERRVSLTQIEVERSLGVYQPDLVANDGHGELLIEIRVTHAVGDEKAARVADHGRRMVEVDLSNLDRDTPHEDAAFAQAVLFESSNRLWVSHPRAVEDWKASKRALDAHIDAINRKIEAERARMQAEQRARVDREARRALEKQAWKEEFRIRERMKYRADLDELFELTDAGRIARLLKEHSAVAQERIAEILQEVPPSVREACTRAHGDAWIFGVDACLWQLLAYQHFIAGKPRGHRFNKRHASEWLRASFPYEQSLYRLFIAQYRGRAEARKAGFAKRRLSYWVFTDQENDRIPNFYDPVNHFTQRLQTAGAIRMLADPIGECEVV